MGLMDILQSALAGANENNADQHFDQVAQHASRDDLSAGVSGVMRSDQTPPFSELIAKTFGQAQPNQQAGMLNQILASLGPAAASGLAGGLLGKLLSPGQTQLTPEQASKLTPAQAGEVAAHAEQQQPGVVDQMSQFYAEHSSLIKTLGGAALMVALAHMKQNANKG